MSPFPVDSKHGRAAQLAEPGGSWGRMTPNGGVPMADRLNVIIAHPLAFLLAIALLLLVAEPIIPVLLRALGNREKISPPQGADLYIWQQIVATQGIEGGMWVARLERLLFFLTVILTPTVAVGWLAFKVASKWEAWTNLHKVPDAIEGVDPLDFLRARMALGSLTYQRFLVGTAANLLAAFIFLGVFYLLSEYLPCF